MSDLINILEFEEPFNLLIECVRERDERLRKRDAAWERAVRSVLCGLNADAEYPADRPVFDGDIVFETMTMPLDQFIAAVLARLEAEGGGA